MSAERTLIHNLIHQGKYSAVTQAANILHPSNKTLTIQESYTDGVRMIVDEENITVLCPYDMGYDRIMEGALAEAIASGEIFDDAEKVKDNAEFIRLTVLPNSALTHNDLPEAKHLTKALTPVISKMNEDTGRFDVTDGDITNGVNCVKNMVDTEDPHAEVRRVMDNYIADHDLEGETDPSPISIGKLADDVKNIKSVKPEDTLTHEDYDMVDYDNSEEVEEGCETCTQEGFFTKRPKKLKPIKRDIVTYVNDQYRAIQTSNDQAMLAGYVSNKLEFIDFYITVIDTNDDRFIVPHSRDYLVSLQNDLNRLLTQILNVKPVNKRDRVWQMNLPDEYVG